MSVVAESATSAQTSISVAPALKNVVSQARSSSCSLELTPDFNSLAAGPSSASA